MNLENIVFFNLINTVMQALLLGTMASDTSHMFHAITTRYVTHL